MAQEIERKFLISGDYSKMVFKKNRITQGYLSSVPERTVRIRIQDEKGFITIKGMSSNNGLTRYEWEKEIPLEEAQELLKLCEPGVIDKTRSLVKIGKHTYEVDHFWGDNEGLVIAEIELHFEEESFIKPDWLGEDVTGIPKYYNASLSKKPYCRW